MNCLDWALVRKKFALEVSFPFLQTFTPVSTRLLQVLSRNAAAPDPGCVRALLESMSVPAVFSG